MKGTPPSAKTHRKILPKTAARMAAVQALYRCAVMGDTSPGGLSAALAYAYEILRDSSTGPGVKPSAAYAQAIAAGVLSCHEGLDEHIARFLAEGRTLKKLGFLLHALLRAAFYEMTVAKDAPPKVLINEYVTIARIFFEGEEPAFVNAVLDKVARGMGG